MGRKPQLGRPNRTTGAFASSFKTRVLPNFLSVIDDPTLKDFQGKSLVGSYDVDDDGVKAQPVTVVQNGTLINYLVGRQPIRDFPNANGHGRALRHRIDAGIHGSHHNVHRLEMDPQRMNRIYQDSKPLSAS